LQILVRVFGLLGLVLSAIPFQFKKHKHIVLCKMVSCLMFSAQYFMIGPVAYTGAWMDLISALRNFLFYKFVDKKLPTLPIILIFSALVVWLGVTSWEGWISLLAIIPKILTTVSYGMSNERILRAITLPSCLFWVAYNCIVGSYEAAAGDLLTLASIIIAIYKFDIRDARRAKEEIGLS